MNYQLPCWTLFFSDFSFTLMRSILPWYSKTACLWLKWSGTRLGLLLPCVGFLTCCLAARKGTYSKSSLRSLAFCWWSCHQIHFAQWLAPSPAGLVCEFLGFDWHSLSLLPYFTENCSVVVVRSLGKEAVRISQRSLTVIITHPTHPLLFRPRTHSAVSRHLCLEPHRAT